MILPVTGPAAECETIMQTVPVPDLVFPSADWLNGFQFADNGREAAVFTLVTAWLWGGRVQRNGKPPGPAPSSQLLLLRFSPVLGAAVQD